MADPIALTGRKTAKEVKGFNCGAVVRLKSGSPHMTVRKAIIGDEPAVNVDWFTSDEEYHSADFLVAEMERVEKIEPEIEP